MPNDQNRIDAIAAGNYLDISDVFLFLIIVWLMFKFNSVVPDIARGLAGFGGKYTSLGDATDHAMSSLGRMGSLAYHVGYLQAMKKLGVPEEKADFIGASRNLKHTYQDLLGSTLEQSADKVIKKITPNEITSLKNKMANFNERVQAGEARINAFQDRFGSPADSISEVSGLLKDHAFYSVSGGIFGKSMHDKTAPGNERTNLDGASERLSKAFGIDPANNAIVKQELTSMGDSIKSLGRGAQVAAGVALLANPFVGAVVGGVALARAGKNIYDSVQNLKAAKAATVQRAGGARADSPLNQARAAPQIAQPEPAVQLNQDQPVLPVEQPAPAVQPNPGQLGQNAEAVKMGADLDNLFQNQGPPQGQQPPAIQPQVQQVPHHPPQGQGVTSQPPQKVLERRNSVGDAQQLNPGGNNQGGDGGNNQ
jgi:hypothetical protein